MNEILHEDGTKEMYKIDMNYKYTPSVTILKKIFKSLLKTNVRLYVIIVYCVKYTCC